MEENTTNQIDAMVTFCRVGDAAAVSRFKLIEKIFQVEFHQPEFDILRKEIGRCYVIDAHQACITLTNHLLERYCKMLLIYVESDFKKITDLSTLEEKFEQPNAKYLDADLSATLQACKRFNLITKEEWKELEEYRSTFRNGYSHANPKQILGDSKGGFMLGSFSGDKENEFRELTYSKVPFLQGLAIEGFSQENALLYFIAVENLIRKTMKHIQAKEDKKYYELIRLVSERI